MRSDPEEPEESRVEESSADPVPKPSSEEPAPEEIKGRLIGAHDDPGGHHNSKSTRDDETHKEATVKDVTEPSPAVEEEKDSLDALRVTLISRKREEDAAQEALRLAELAREPEPDVGKAKKPSKKYVPAKLPGPLSWLVMIGSVISFLAALIAVIMELSGPATFELTAIGFVLAAGFMTFNRQWVRESLSSRSARYTANVTTVIISLLGIMILLNILGYKYHYRVDLSSDGIHSLAPQSLRVLEDIDRAGEPVEIIAFAPNTAEIRGSIEASIERYLYKSDNLSFRFVDPDIERELTDSKGIVRIPSILFELGDKRTTVNTIDEAHITSALMEVRKTHSPIISFIMGHDEPNPYSDHIAEDGVSKFRERLELENYQVNELSIPESNGVPPETSILIVINPRTTLHPMEIDAVTDYLDQGGSMICLLEPGKSAGLSDLVGTYGIALNNDIVLDDERNFFGEWASPTLHGDPGHPITAPPDFDRDSLNPLFLSAGSLDYTIANKLPGTTLESIIRSSLSSWSETSDIYRFDEGIEERDAQEMALLATIRHSDGLAESPGIEPETGEPSDEPGQEEDSPDENEKVTQLFVVNDSSFVRNANIDHYDNSDFILNAVSYLSMRRDLISVRAAERTDRTLELTRMQASTVFVVSVLLTPLLVACFGGFVWWRRRQ